MKLEEVFNNVKGAQIIFTGAGSKNLNLIHYISEIIKEKKFHLEIKTTYQPEISIIKGAVLFGFQSNIIRERKYLEIMHQMVGNYILLLHLF